MSKSAVPIKEFRLELSDLTYTGHDLVRPESILAQPNGTLWVSDGRGGLTRIDPDGNQQFLGGLGGEPNGLAMAEDGTIYVANIGTGTIQKVHPGGRAEEFLTEVDGVKLTTADFVTTIQPLFPLLGIAGLSHVPAQTGSQPYTESQE